MTQQRSTPPTIEQTVLGYNVPGLAFVQARPVRPENEAREIAIRIARDPASYLSACVELGVDGIRDLRSRKAGR